eukprot:1957439-Alexandrium_andersonii.AAC.1
MLSVAPPARCLFFAQGAKRNSICARSSAGMHRVVDPAIVPKAIGVASSSTRICPRSRSAEFC